MHRPAVERRGKREERSTRHGRAREDGHEKTVRRHRPGHVARAEMTGSFFGPAVWPSVLLSLVKPLRRVGDACHAKIARRKLGVQIILRI